jgi:uncharacterized membrane protein
MIVAANGDRIVQRAIHPLHAALLAGFVPLYVGAVLSDLAYTNSYEIQWSNFAAWLLAGAMVLTGLTLAWGLIDFLRAPRRLGWPLLYALLVLAVFVVGLLDCFVHAKDAWAVMPDGLVLSVIVALVAIAAAAVGLSSVGSRVPA